MAIKVDTLFHKTEHTIGLKMPLYGSTSNSRPFRHCLAKKCKSHILHATELALLTTTVSEISNLQSEPIDNLKVLPRGTTSNFKSNWQRLTQH